MAYTPTEWKDRVVQYPNRYKDQADTQYTFTRDEGTITEAGTQISAINMNKIEGVLADQDYQTPTIVGTQIQLVKNGSGDRLFFKLNADISGNLTISIDGGVTEVPLKNIEGEQVTDLSMGFVEVVDNTTFFTYAPKSGAIEDIIKNYIVSSDGNISAGDLCEFINGQIKKTNQTYHSSTQVDSSLNIGTTQFIHSCRLTETTVLIVYSASQKPTGVIATLNLIDKTISYGTPVTLSTTSGTSIFVETLSPTVAVVDFTGVSNTFYLYGLVVNISNGNIISCGNTYQLSTTTSNICGLTKIDDFHMLCSYVNPNFNNLYSFVLFINDLVISYGTKVVLSTSSAVVGTSCKIYGDNQLYAITYVDNVNYYLHISTFKIDFLYTITLLKSTLIISMGINTPNLYSFSENRLLAVYEQSSGTLPYVCIIALNDSDIVSIGTPVCLNVGELWDTNRHFIVQLDETHYLLPYNYNNTNLKCFSIEIKDMSITVISTFTITASPSLKVISSYVNKNEIYSCFINSSNIICSIIIGIDNDYIPTISDVVVHSKSPQILALKNANIGENCKCLIKGIGKGLNNLIPSNYYYCDDNGNLTLTENKYKIGFSISNTELLIENDFIERGL